MNNKETRQLTFTIEMDGKREYKLLTQNTALEKAKIVAIRTRRAGANRKSLQGKAIVNDANFESAFITLKKGSDEVWQELPVEHIETATKVSPETGFRVDWQGIDWNTTKLILAEGTVVDLGKVFEFTVEYI